MSKVEMKVGEWYEDGINCRCYCALELPDNVGGTHRFVCYNQAGTIETYTASGVYYNEADESDLDIVRHLPGCTGFDWQEPKIPEGWRRLADDEVLTKEDKYLQADGKLDIVYSYTGRTVKATQEAWSHPPTFPYACIRKIEEPKPEPKFKVGDVVYATKPENTKEHPSWDSCMDDTAGIPMKVTRVDIKDCTCACEVKGADDWWWYRENWLSKEPPAAQYRPFANDEEYASHFDRPVKRAYNKYPEGKGAYKIAAYDEYGVWHREGGAKESYEEMYKLGRKFADTNEPFGVKIS